MKSTRSTFNVLFFLKRDKVKKNGCMPIQARITIDGVVSGFSTKLEILPDNWNVTAGKASGRSAEMVKINSMLDEIRSVIHKHYHELQQRDSYVTAEKVKNAFLGKEELGKTLIQVFNQHNEQYLLKVGTTATRKTYSRYELTKNRMIDFLKEKYSVSDISIREINVVFIENFYLYIRANSICSHNTTMKFIQRFRTVIYYAKNMGLITVDPFACYKLKFDYVDRGYLDQQEIDTIYMKQFASKRLEQVRDMFIFSCYCGLSYVDVCELTRDNIRTAFDGTVWIMKNRHKTNVASNIRLLDIPKDILAKYEGKLPNNQLLPIISNQKMNDYLKEIATVCGINKVLTYHVARHSFATLSLGYGVPIETVSKMLGHTNIRTTQIYAKITDTKLSSDMDIFAEKLNARKIATI